MEKKICYRCTRQLNADGKCVCGFDINKYNTALYHLIPGTSLRDRYIVGTVIGEGGFGITYVGYDKLFNRKVAIKEFYMTGYVSRTNTYSMQLVTTSGDKEEIFKSNLEKFLKEGQILAKYNDISSIVSILDYFKENDTAYIVMEYVEGNTLKQYCRKNGPMSFEKVKEIFLPLIDALSIVHKDNIIHRDISPDNIIISEDNKIRLLDFGAAREFEADNTKSMSIILRPGYAPEEQYRKKGKQGPWTDVYSVCATIYFCMTGNAPDNSIERMVDDELKPLCELASKCPKEFSNVIMKGLSVFKDGRYQSMAELKAALVNEVSDLHRYNRKESRKTLDDTDYTLILDSEENAAVKPEKVDSAGSPSVKNKKKFLWLIFFAMLLVACLIIVLSLKRASKEKEILIKAMEDTVAEAGENFDSYCISAQENLLEFANSPIVSDCLKNPEDINATEAAQQYTLDFFESLEGWESIYIADWNSKVITFPAYPVVGRVMRDGERLEELRNDLLASDGVLDYGIITSSASGQPIISMYVPVFDGDKPIGYVCGGVPVQNIAEINSDISRLNHETAFMYFTDRDGTIIYHQNEEKLGTRVENTVVIRLVEEIHNGQHPVSQCDEYDYRGVKKYAAYYVGINENYIAMLTVDKTDALADCNRVVTRRIIIAILLIVGVWFLTLILSNNRGNYGKENML